MVRASKRRRYNNDTANSRQLSTVFNDDPSAAATAEEKRRWQGFCEIESEPAFFNVMLKEFGVQGVKVQELVGLDEVLLDFLPKPVYGLIFLFRFAEDSRDEDEGGCPEHIWFANQTTGNACATVALLNIVNNIPDIELGENLKNFRAFTRDFAPTLRGEQVAHFEFIKQIHNSFGRKIDMMNIDLAMKNEYTRSTAKGKRAAKRSEDDEAGFHFIAYIPIAGEVWKLDGLDRQPDSLGSFSESDWLSVVAPIISERMIAYEEDQIEFGLLAVVKDPITERREQLADNMVSITAIERALGRFDSQWTAFLTDDEQCAKDGTQNDELKGPTGLYGITEDMLTSREVPSTVADKIAVTVTEDVAELMNWRETLVRDQLELKVAIKEEEQSALADEERARSRRSDFGPLIRKWLRLLAEKDLLKPLMDELA